MGTATGQEFRRFVSVRLSESDRRELERRAECFGSRPAMLARKAIADWLRKPMLADGPEQ